MALKKNNPHPVLPCGNETSIKNCITVEDTQQGKIGILWYNTTGNDNSTKCIILNIPG